MNNKQQPAPQDLRERAESIVNEYNAFLLTEDEAINAMIKFAAEVAGLLKKRIKEMESELSGIKTQRQHDMLLAEAAVKQISELGQRLKISDEWIQTCVKDALLVASEQDEQWKDKDTARLVLQKIRGDVPIEYLK